jgi:hypothetical protein
VNTPETEPQTDDRIGDDLLRGAIEIAAELRVKPHQVNYIYKTKKLPNRQDGQGVHREQEETQERCAEVHGGVARK